MGQTIARCITALLLCCTSPLLLAASASQIQANYDVIGYGMTLANITETFSRKEDNYESESVTKAVGLLARIKPETVRVTSQGKITPQGLVPLSFSMTRVHDTDKNASAKFNWEKAVVTHNDYKGLNDLPLAKGTQDRLSVLHHLSRLVKSDQAEFKFSITDGNNMDDYSFNFSPQESDVTVPLGTFKTRYISSSSSNPDAMRYEIWLATEHDNVPCKIIVTDSKGGKLTQVLTQLTITP
jgi:hypothetical protein